MNELNLNDGGTIEALKLTDVMPTIIAEKQPQGTITFTRKFTQEEIDRLSRLSPEGDWQLGINAFIDDTLATRVGRPVIRGASYHGTVTAPSNRFDK